MPVEIRLLRDHARKFDANRFSNHEEVARAMQRVLQEIFRLRERRGEKILHVPALLSHVETIVLDAYCAYKSPPYIYLAISRRTTDYTKRVNRYGGIHLTYRYTTGVLDDLVVLGFLNQSNGFFDKSSNSGYRTRICATENLVEILDGYGVRREMIERMPSESIRLRDGEKHFVDYEDTDATHQMRRNLAAINQAIGQRQIRLSCDDQQMDELFRRMAHDRDRGAVDFDDCELYRVFNNNSFEQGGRFYGGWWQRIPKEYRTHLYIDRKNTIEIDYSGLHIRLLYGKAGVQCPDDPYDLADYSRGDQKTAVLTILNSADRKKAVHSLRRKGVKDAGLLCNALIERHQPIADSFYTGIGTKLQFQDSMIAELVMLKIIKLGGIALPVHDSFIVRVGREEELKTAMDEAFQEVFPNIASKHKRKADLLELRAKNRTSTDEIQFVSTSLTEILSGSDGERSNRI